MKATIWPEQEAVLSWLEKQGMKKDLASVQELIEAVTQPRFKEMEKLERLRHLWLSEDCPEKIREIEKILEVRPCQRHPQEEVQGRSSE